MRVTINAVNKALADKGYNAELVRDDGYFYFSGQDADKFEAQGVYVYRLNELTLDQWIEEFESKLKEYAQ